MSENDAEFVEEMMQDGDWQPGSRMHRLALLARRGAEAAARIEQLEAYALKAFTVVEFCAGEGLLLPHPHYDCDDLLMEGVDLLKVETSEEARAALGGAND
jgi:hypothetical protein